MSELVLPEQPTIDVRRFQSPGPVSTRFLNDRTSPVRAIMGPQGGGKTTTCCYDLLRNALLMPPCIDGVRRFKALCVRDTYDRLYRSAVASWLSIMPKSEGDWEGGQGRPARHRLRIPGNHGMLEFEINFIAIGDQAVEDVMRGYEFTALWMNEADRLAEEVLVYGIGRGPRYPAAPTLPPGTSYRFFAIMDLNAPDYDNWVYSRFIEDLQPGHVFYRQPSGRSPHAENLQNLIGGRKYYDDQVALNAARPDWIRRMVDNEFGYSRDGQPVYPEFSDQLHVAAEPLSYVPGVRVVIGLDAGLHPAAAFCQPMPDGQLRVVDEIDPGRMGPTRFADRMLELLARVPASCAVQAFADPTSFAGADKEGGELSWAQMMSAALQLHVLPAPSNELTLRLGAVQKFLGRTLYGGRPAFLLSPACKALRRGFNSEYHFRRAHGGNGKTFEDKPSKNDASHVQDCVQYAALGILGRHAVVQSAAPIQGNDPRWWRNKQLAGAPSRIADFSAFD